MSGYKKYGTFIKWNANQREKKKKKKKISPFAIVWMDMENIMLSEISQSQKDKYYVISLIYGI